MIRGLVHVQDIQYIWNSEDLAVVSVSPRSCKACAFYEDRKFPLKKVNGHVAITSLLKSQTLQQCESLQLSTLIIALYLTSLNSHTCCFMPEGMTRFAAAANTSWQIGQRPMMQCLLACLLACKLQLQ